MRGLRGRPLPLLPRQRRRERHRAGLLQALGLYAIDTCYSEIGGSLLEQALDYHRQAVELMGQPAGNMLGAWLWSEMGQWACSPLRSEPVSRS